MRASKQLAALLEENRETILGKWFELIIGSYPEVTTGFLAKQKDRFRNPVGFAINESIGPIYDQVVSEMDTEQILTALDGIIRIRSVQDFTPTETVGFVFQLKDVIREVIDGRAGGDEERSDLRELESRIDRVALLAFEKYTECREQLHRVRNREIERRARKVLDRVRVESETSRNAEEPTDDGA
jgi:hypothetical protein